MPVLKAGGRAQEPGEPCATGRIPTSIASGAPVIAFLPFPTAVYGTHFSDGVAQMLYAGAVCTAGYLASMMWVWTLRTPALLHKGIDLGEVRHSLHVSLIMPTGFAVSIPGSLIYPPAVPYIWIAFAAATPFLRKL
ncbi:MAG: hypothetical protein ACYC6Z_00600 [Thermoleophilia bacterium]